MNKKFEVLNKLKGVKMREIGGLIAEEGYYEAKLASFNANLTSFSKDFSGTLKDKDTFEWNDPTPVLGVIHKTSEGKSIAERYHLKGYVHESDEDIEKEILDEGIAINGIMCFEDADGAIYRYSSDTKTAGARGRVLRFIIHVMNFDPIENNILSDKNLVKWLESSDDLDINEYIDEDAQQLKEEFFTSGLSDEAFKEFVEECLEFCTVSEAGYGIKAELVDNTKGKTSMQVTEKYNLEEFESLKGKTIEKEQPAERKVNPVDELEEDQY